MNLPAKLKHIMILTGEPSGDFHGGRLVSEIRKINPDIYFSGIGGHYLKSRKVDLFCDIKELSVMGFTEVILQLKVIKSAFDQFRSTCLKSPPDLIILIDYPGFNLKCAKFAKTTIDSRILYYITPKVWAWKKNRLKSIRKYVDHAALILPFEKKIFTRANIPSTYVGNPLMDEFPICKTRVFSRYNRPPSRSGRKTVIGLLPGSRKNEVKNLLGIMLQSARLIALNHPDVRFVISQAISIEDAMINSIIKSSNTSLDYKIRKGPVKHLFDDCNFLIAASGTVTLEAALCCLPTIIVYRLSPVSFFIAKHIVKIKYAGLANLILDKEVMPELLQSDATPEKISRLAIVMLNRLEEIENSLFKVRTMLGTSEASKRTATIALEMLDTG
jgi:lipid-A-disaccharide synthase